MRGRARVEGLENLNDYCILLFLLYTITYAHAHARAHHTHHITYRCATHVAIAHSAPSDHRPTGRQPRGRAGRIARAYFLNRIIYLARALGGTSNPILFFYPTITVIVHFMASWRCSIAITVHCIRSGNRRHCVDVTRPSTFIWRLIRKSRIPSTFVVVM